MILVPFYNPYHREINKQLFQTTRFKQAKCIVPSKHKFLTKMNAHFCPNDIYNNTNGIV